MKLQTKSLTNLREACEVVPGNIYPAKGGRKPEQTTAELFFK